MKVNPMKSHTGHCKPSITLKLLKISFIEIGIVYFYGVTPVEFYMMNGIHIYEQKTVTI